MRKAETENIERMKRAMAELYAKRQQALERVCPECWGPLKIKDLCNLVCPDCSLVFTVEQLLQNSAE